MSAQALAEAEGRSFYYWWPVNDKFGASFADLWDYSGGAEVSAPGPEPRLQFWSFTNTDLMPHRHDAVLSLEGNQVVPGFEGPSDWERLVSRLTPSPAVQAKVDAISHQLPESYVGVQIRADKSRTEATLNASPVQWFIDRMREIKSDYPGTVFFLSADTEQSRRDVLAVVDDVVSVEKRGAYNSSEALVDAVTDLVVLAKSAHIVGPHGSSFVELAWFLGGRSQAMETSRSTRHKYSHGKLTF